ncbi:MAG: HD domain-containing protein [Myxococcaceae bacterium]
MSIQIRDSIHGSIAVSYEELQLIDHPVFQRLRNIKQLGFADFAFPGATHSRYSHSLGAMEMATRIFDSLFNPGDLDEAFRKRMRQAVRLAMLLHDIGHPPLSHTMEMRMPVGVTHEAYTHKLLTDSCFSAEITRLFADLDITELDFKHGGLNYQPVLKQIISSECDADRMDYLQRDSFYCGVNYGKFDADWLINSLVALEQNNSVYLGIKSKGMFSFEDFLLSRYHMFASVYLHHTPVIFEKMLQKYFEESPEEFLLPEDVEAYVKLDDTDIQMHLRQSQNTWAQRIVQRKPYSLLSDELSVEEYARLCQLLKQEKIDFIESRSSSAISKYFGVSKIPLYVQTKRGEAVLLESYTELFKRYQRPAQFNRIYVAPKDKERARALSQAL